MFDTLVKGEDIDFSDDSESVDLHFRLRKIGRYPLSQRERRLRSASKVISDLAQREPKGLGNVRNVRMRGHFLKATVACPTASDEAVSELATGVMRNVARNLGVPGNDRVFAAIRRADVELPGVVLWAGPDKTCNTFVRDYPYQPGDRDFVLVSHGITSYAEQAVCLAGIATIAEADRLLLPAATSVTMAE